MPQLFPRRPYTVRPSKRRQGYTTHATREVRTYLGYRTSMEETRDTRCFRTQDGYNVIYAHVRMFYVREQGINTWSFNFKWDRI